MASAVQKWNDYYRFCFTSAEKKREGLPRQKWFAYPVKDYKKSDVQEIRRVLDKEYRSGKWDPWKDPLPVKETTESISLFEAAERWIEHKKHSHPYNTIQSYQSDLNTLKRTFGDIPIHHLDRASLNEYINEPKAYNTRTHRKQTMEGMLKWLEEDGLAEYIPLKVEGKKVDRETSILVITEEQFLDLLDKSYWLNDILRVAFYMGLRISELAALRPAWVVDGKFLRVGDLKVWGLPDEFHPKSQKEHDPLIAIPPQVEDIFSGQTGYDRMFGYKRKTLGEHLSKRLKDLPSPLNEAVTGHHLRHSCASFWINEKGIPVQEVQRLLRHADIKTTMQYYHPNKDVHYRVFQKS